MKLAKEQITLLDLAVQAAISAGIDKLIIEPGKVRGIDEKKTVVLISEVRVPDLGGKTLSLNRLSLFQDRINLVKESDNFSIELVNAKTGDDINQVNLSGGNTKTSFKCANSETIKGIPKGVNDNWEYAFDVTKTSLDYITRAVSAMSADTVTITCKDKKTVDVELYDVNKDSFVCKLAESITSVSPAGKNGSFAYNYPAKTLLPLLKKVSGESISFILGEKGILQIFINEHSIMVLPLL
jgi:hypothetical protein